MAEPLPERPRGGALHTIDFHAHITDPDVLERTAAHSVFTSFGMRPRPVRPAIDAKVQDPEVHLADMRARRVDQAVLLHSTVHTPITWADPETGMVLARQQNETMAKWIAIAPDRFLGSAIVSFGNVQDAVREASRCADELGFRVVETPARHGEYLGHPGFWPFWEVVQERDLVVFIHPDGTRDPWFQNYSLWNSLGQSFEETKVIASLIYEGTLDRFPDVKIVMAHGGGYFPHTTGRVDRNVAKPEAMKNIDKAPSTYLRRFHYDSCMYDPLALGHLIQRVGADRIVLGSDYPFGEMDPLLSAAALPVVDDAELALIAHGNARRLLGLSSS
jgi:aminocarboxymuconate-semialdehyde decarboxylase